jgi:hypothetical protein
MCFGLIPVADEIQPVAVREQPIDSKTDGRDKRENACPDRRPF